MKLTWSILIVALALSGHAAEQQSELAIGRAYYSDGEFKKASVHFQLAVKADPKDAGAYYWLGRSHEILASIAAPFDGRDNAKARASLTRAVELAPASREYRRELFDFLLDSADSSRSALPQAEAMLRTMPRDDPEYDYMRQRFENESRQDASLRIRLGRLIGSAPQTVIRIVELPASALSRHDQASALPTGQ
jgi:tetratricopeptide (TPR) repeat protein